MLQDTEHGLLRHTIAIHHQPDERIPKQLVDISLILGSGTHDDLRRPETPAREGDHLLRVVHRTTRCFTTHANSASPVMVCHVSRTISESHATTTAAMAPKTSAPKNT